MKYKAGHVFTSQYKYSYPSQIIKDWALNRKILEENIGEDLCEFEVISYAEITKEA